MPLASPKYPFKESAVQGAPTDPGLYALYSEQELMCIGVAFGREPADTIRARLLAHLNGDFPNGRATHYRWEITHDPLTRRALYLNQLGRFRGCEELRRWR